MPTRAHGCAAAATIHADDFAHRSANEQPQRAAIYNALRLLGARCRVVSRGGVTLLATLATAWQVKCRNGAAALLRMPQQNQLQPRVLNLPQFANGFVYAGSRAHEQYGVVPFVFHATYTNDKVMKLQEEGFFRNDPSY